MADVTLTVDGKKLKVPAGTLLIEACKRRHRDAVFLLLPRLVVAGRVPHVPGGNREDAQDADRLHHAHRRRHGWCDRERQGLQARKSTLELLLANHPLDCPVCDAGGECELQDMTFKYGAGESRSSSTSRAIATSSSGRRWCSTTGRAAFSATAACAFAVKAWTSGRSVFRIAARFRHRAQPGRLARVRRVRHVH